MPENGKLQTFRSESCSGQFVLSFCHSGSIEVECTACGRVHFVDDETFFDDRDTFKECKQGESENPEKYLARNDVDTISWFNFGGKQVVFDCPCNFARLIEETLWDERHDITEYLMRRASKEKIAAERDATDATSAHSAVRDK